MSRFKVGQEVIFSKGELKDVRGVIVVPWYQVAASDYPEVVVQHGDDLAYLRVFVDIDDVRPAVDPYEYGATWKMSGSEEYYPVFSDEWGTLESAQEELSTVRGEDYRDPKIMRRLKAGEPEDYDV